MRDGRVVTDSVQVIPINSKRRNGESNKSDFTFATNV